jgi:hypothetical protein
MIKVRFHIRTLMLAVLMSGLFVGNYSVIMRQMSQSHPLKLILVSSMCVMMQLMVIKFIYDLSLFCWGLTVLFGWSLADRLKGRMNRHP